jgi:AcrR family transcriptional regulator
MTVLLDLRPRLDGMSSLAPDAVTHRDRLLTAAARFTSQHGWGELTMGKLADLVGVSRQTVYNEIGGKRQLAEAMVLRELELFLDVVDSAFQDNPDDLVEAIEAAALRVLELACTDPLLHAILSSSQGADSELLPLLTTNSEPVLGAAGEMIRSHVASYDVDLPGDRVEVLIDMVVRLVLSHVMQPTAQPAQTAETIAWIAGRLLTA